MTEVDSHLPEYTLEDKTGEIVIRIVAPLSKPKEAALVLENDVFTFDSPPYFLKFKLPHPVSDRFSEKNYDSSTGTFKIKLKKESRRQEYNSDDEDLINPIEISSNDESTKSGIERNGNKQFYGFANKYSNMFGKFYDEFSEVVNLPDPDNTDVIERRILRVKEETEKWSDDHYLADTMETDHLESIFNYNPPWIVSPVKDELNNDEKEMLSEIIKTSKITNLTGEDIRLSEFQIVEILYCYSYNKRTTEGENTVESGWTINKLSSTLSWFEVFEDLKTVVLNCYKRSLIYPLYRNWKLNQMIHEDVVNILKIGSKQVTHCVLEVLEIFNESDNRYILNTLYLKDLCSFAYRMTNERAAELSRELKKINIKKCEVNSELPLLEIAAHLTLEEETEGSGNRTESNMKNIIERIGDMRLNRESSSSETDSEDSDSTQSSDKEN